MYVQMSSCTHECVISAHEKIETSMFRVVVGEGRATSRVDVELANQKVGLSEHLAATTISRQITRSKMYSMVASMSSCVPLAQYVCET